MRTSLLCTIAMVSFAFREAIRTNIIATSATVYKISFVFAVFERKKKEVRNALDQFFIFLLKKGGILYFLNFG